MKGYYCISPRDREFLFIPFVLLSYCSANSTKPVHNWDENTLENLTLIFSEGRITRERLEDRGWEIHDVKIPDKIVKRFRDFCFKHKSEKKIKAKAERIFNSAYRFVEYEGEHASSPDENSHVYSDGYDDYDIEDYWDDWWMRGEEPPSFERY